MSTDEQLAKFADLTWQDLEEWARARVVRRGKSYRARVQKLGTVGDSGLLATVVGTSVCATLVERTEDGALSCLCSCPYSWGRASTVLPWFLPPSTPSPGSDRFHLFRQVMNDLWSSRPGANATRTTPPISSLTGIALHEGRHDDAVTWYQSMERKPWVHYRDLADAVAAAVKDTHPDVTLEIWRNKAEGWIALVKPSAYESAGGYLTQMGDLCLRDPAITVPSRGGCKAHIPHTSFGAFP